MSVKINTLELENVKKIKAVQLVPSKNGLTIIGGKNRQGKTSVLDSIAWALGGDRFKPSQPHREGSVNDPHLKITLDNGIVVERSGKNGALKVLDPSGNRAGQQLLNGFVEAFALDLPRFMNGSSKDKADTLLKIIGVGDRLYELDREEKRLYDERRFTGQIADQKRKYADELPEFPDAPAEPVSASELIARQQEILLRNAENQRKRDELNRLTMKKHSLCDSLTVLDERIAEMQQKRAEMLDEYNKTAADEETALDVAAGLVDEPTAEIEADINRIDEINRKVRSNAEKARAAAEAGELSEKYTALTSDIEAVRQARTDLLNGADLPLPGLSVENGELLYMGHRWDGMSGAEQLIVSASIVRRLNPECGFVLLDKLEQLDLDTLNRFGEWLEKEGLQAIATRVSTGDECSIIIEDGIVQTDEPKQYKGFGEWTGKA
ncbi:MAG: AAA family ATPase [Ruminococcus sp.]|nr:AAA family ATPase [Ruminococcus sp.]